MLRSMTAFASAKGGYERFSWTWEMRSVNGKGLDLRLRVPDWISGLEAGLKGRLSKALSRGNVSLALRLQADEAISSLTLNQPQLDAVLTAMAEVETQAMERGISLAPANAADVVSVRGVLESAGSEDAPEELCKVLLQDFEGVLSAFLEMREGEGNALSEVLNRQLAQISTLTKDASAVLEARQGEASDALHTALARVVENLDGLDETRIAQELAILAVKADITEELDRLYAHIKAAQDLLSKGSPVGRKLDFLSQEFNREANTLCSKSQNTALTAIGLELKTVIDQMREQVQNVE